MAAASTKTVLHRDHNAIAEETEKAAPYGDTRQLYQVLKSVRPTEVREALFEQDGSIRPLKPEGFQWGEPRNATNVKSTRPT